MRHSGAGCLVLVVAWLPLAGCGGSGPGNEVARSTPTREQLANATYRGFMCGTATLTDGRFEGPAFDPGGAARPVVEWSPESLAFGDLDGDGIDEAVVVLVEQGGGSGSFVYLAAASRSGDEVENLATVLLGDRVRVLDVSVGPDALLRADLVVHGPADPACCPTEEARRVWRLRDGDLIEQTGGREG